MRWQQSGGEDFASTVAKNYHQQVLQYVLNQVLPSMSDVLFRNNPHIGIEVRPLIIGGMAYQIHMQNAGLSTYALPTFDIDFKFIVRSSNTIGIWRPLRAACVRDLLYMTVEYLKTTRIVTEGMRIELAITWNFTTTKITASSDIEDVYQRMSAPSHFVQPVDLCMIKLKYYDLARNKVVLNSGFIDVSVTTYDKCYYTYTLWQRYMEIKSPYLDFENVADAAVEMDSIDGRVFYASFYYCLVDTLRMISYAFALVRGNSNVVVNDVYKTVKYVIKYIHLNIVELSKPQFAQDYASKRQTLVGFANKLTSLKTVLDRHIGRSSFHDTLKEVCYMIEQDAINNRLDIFSDLNDDEMFKVLTFRELEPPFSSSGGKLNKGGRATLLYTHPIPTTLTKTLKTPMTSSTITSSLFPYEASVDELSDKEIVENMYANLDFAIEGIKKLMASQNGSGKQKNSVKKNKKMKKR